MSEADIWQPRTILEVTADTKMVTQPFTAILNQTVFVITDFAYAVGTGALQIYKNGNYLTPDIDFIEQTDTTFSLLDPADAGDAIVAVGNTGISGTVDVRDTDIFLANYQAIRDYAGTEVTIYAQGTTTKGDGGENFFQKFTGAAPGTYVDDNYNTIVPTGGDGSVGWIKSVVDINPDTMADLEALPLEAGILVTTKEFHAGRLGGGTYLIKAPQAFDGFFERELVNGNIAVLQVPYSFTPNQIGAKGDDATNDYAALWAGIQKSATTRKPMILLPGFIYRHETAFAVDATTYANFSIRGATHGIAGGVLKPVDCALFNFDGTLATGNFVFNINLRDFYIDGSAVTVPVTDLIKWNNFYRCNMENIWSNNVPVEEGVTVSNILTTEGTCYENTFKRIMDVGGGNTGSGKAFNFAHTLGHLLLDQPDAENLFTGLYFAADTRVDIISPHLERVGTGFNIRPGTIDGNTQINCLGGTCDLGSATTSGILMSGTYEKNEMINFDGLRFTSNDHATKKQAFNVGSMVWNNNTKMSLTNLDWSWITAHPLLREAAHITPTNPFAGNAIQNYVYTMQKTGLVDVTATDIFKLDAFDSASPYGPVYVKIKAFVSHNGYGRAIEESVFVIQDRGALDAAVSAKQIIAAVQETDSANYSITTFEVSAIENADDITFQVTSDFNNSIVTTMDPYFEVEVIGQATFTEL